MTKTTYTQDQMDFAKWAFKIIASVPPEKRFLVAMATEAFINGMEAQERLNAHAGQDSA